MRIEHNCVHANAQKVHAFTVQLQCTCTKLLMMGANSFNAAIPQQSLKSRKMRSQSKNRSILVKSKATKKMARTPLFDENLDPAWGVKLKAEQNDWIDCYRNSARKPNGKPQSRSAIIRAALDQYSASIAQNGKTRAA